MGRKAGWLREGEFTRTFSKFNKRGVNEVFNMFMSTLIALVLDSNFAETMERTSLDSPALTPSPALLATNAFKA